MGFTEFCCRSGGSNLNAGTLTGNATEPGTAASFTYASGSWVASTGVFTVASGNPSGDGVAVGDFASVYPDAATVSPFVGRITARDTTTITVSLTVKSGTAPVDGTTNTTLKVGGAWKGPNAAVGFPFGFVQATMVNAAGLFPRVNFKNDAQYDVTAAMTHANAGNTEFQGYTTAYGDLGRATIDGGTSGASYILLTVSGANCNLIDLIFANNGATGTANGVVITGSEGYHFRSVAHGMRGAGFLLQASQIGVELEAYACNASNTVAIGGITTNNTGATWITLKRCISHDNVGGTSCHGFVVANATLIQCIADTNAGKGFLVISTTSAFIDGCDVYNNAVDGIDFSPASGVAIHIENSNLVKNGGWGINCSAGPTLRNGAIVNCGFGAGTQANASGTINTTMTSVHQIGSVNYASDVTPWVDPANGDFRINLAAAINAGRGKYTQTAASYAGTVGYPDLGASDHLESAGGGRPEFRGSNL